MRTKSKRATTRTGGGNEDAAARPGELAPPVVVEFRELTFQDHPFGGPMVLRVRVDPSGAVQAVEALE